MVKSCEKKMFILALSVDVVLMFVQQKEFCPSAFLRLWFMIKKVKWKEHPILGNLELDFTKEDGSIYNTIVFAGENGTL